MRKVIIVDQQDNIIGHKFSDKVLNTDIYRVSALWLTNSIGQILLAKRTANKKHHPNKWGPAVAGTIEQGESYDDNIIKEAEEEIGLKNIKFIKGPKKLNIQNYKHFTQWYTAVLDKDIKDFVLQPEEVAEIRWFTKQEIEDQLKNDPEFFIPNFPYYFELFE